MSRALEKRVVPPRPEWCSVRLRFSPEELALLRGAETVQGGVLSQDHRASALRDALTLMKAGRRLAGAQPNSSVVLAEPEAAALRSALRTTLLLASRYHDHVLGWRGQQSLAPEEVSALEDGFPSVKGSPWEASRLERELKALAARLEAPLDGR